ncbi:flagellin domain protein [Rhodothermus marinus SG0.5JP17-172]|uniref:flagellin n=1 Tax=Rhodothermus marinus TaxID=29549 RepID=UPI000223D8EC|nr:flagellin [Rhodothermus marinus]AEN73981.1 flagellin domain protein [Rhodothermus marinus SG0.5JP17-172]
MSFGDLTRINTNLQSLQAYTYLQRTNTELGLRQLRLATGSRINRAEDDSAGYSIAAKLKAKIRGQEQALANIGDAKSLLTVAEGSLNSIMDILQTMKEKVIQAANDTMGAEERDAIENQLNQLTAEIGDILAATKFNGKALFSDSGTVTLQFQVGDSTDAQDNFKVTIEAISAGGLFSSSTSFNTSEWTIDSVAAATDALAAIETAIQTVAEHLGKIGDYQKRLSFKMDNLATAKNNYEAARSRIADADFAYEQMQLAKLQILQQTGVAALAQANAAPQSVLQLF